MPDVLVLYASVEGHTARIAERIAVRLRDRGFRVDVAPADAQLKLSDYAGVIVGASVHYGRHPAWLARLLRRHIPQGQKTAFFSVSLGAKQTYANRFLRRARWTPDLVAVFAGALQYRKYAPLKRLLVRAFAAVARHDTDTSQDHEYTNWQAVDAFAAAFSQRLISAS